MGGTSLQATEFLEPIEFKSPYEDIGESPDLESMDQEEVNFSNEGLAFLKYLERNIALTKEDQYAMRGLGGFVAGTGLLLAPATFGITLILTGAGAGTIAAGESVKKELNGWRLVKAAYVHHGYKNPGQQKLKKHDNRISQFIKKYLKIEADSQTVDRVAKAIVIANEKGWFGMVYDNSAVLLQSTRRQEVANRLFPNNGISPNLLQDTTAAEKLLRYAEVRNEYQEKRKEIMENA